MKKLLNNDNFLRILSVVIAILCWIYIIFIDNPEIEVKIADIPITLADHQAIKDEGYVISTETANTINIKLRGTRQMLANISKDNILAYIDLSGCTNKGTYKLPVIVKLPYEEVKVISKSIYNMSVAVDDYVSRRFNIDYVYNGDTKSSDYIVNKTTLDAKTVTVYGPSEIIKTVEKAVCEINLGRTDEDISGISDIILLNSNSSEIKSANIELSTDTVGYKCEIYQKKTVDIIPSFSENTNSIKYSIPTHKTVKITGPAKVVKEIASLSTDDILVNQDELPHEYVGTLIIPKNVETEDNITKVNVLVESK